MKQIAVVDMQCRFTGNAQSPDEFFEQLLNADEFSDDIPFDRWSNHAFFSNDIAAGKTTCGRGSFLDKECRDFDPDVFALPADEISSLDPQQRRVLEVAWEALELVYRRSSAQPVFRPATQRFGPLFRSRFHPHDAR